MSPRMSKLRSVRPGIEVALSQPPAVLRGAIGLVANQAAVDSELRSDIDLLAALPGAKLAALFGPEHGIRGAAQAGEHVTSATDSHTGLPVYSLYGKTHKPTAEMLNGIDVLVVDLPDAGARYWTFLYTMAYCLQTSGETGIPVVILDRPNPIGGVRVEGNILDPAFASFVGMYPLPMRHGMTIGEVARYLNATYNIGANLTVVPCVGWERDMLLWDTGLPYVPGSPNTPTIESLLLYPGTCLFEGTTLSEGRGTTKPFEQIGAPYIDAIHLADAMRKWQLPGVGFRPAYFVPTFSKHQGEQCGGVQIHITDADAVDAVAIGVYLITTIRDLYPDHFGWRPPYSAGGRHFIDLLAGGDAFRQAVDTGKSPAAILADWVPARQAFQSACSTSLLYPYPAKGD